MGKYISLNEQLYRMRQLMSEESDAGAEAMLGIEKAKEKMKDIGLTPQEPNLTLDDLEGVDFQVRFYVKDPIVIGGTTIIDQGDVITDDKATYSNKTGLNVRYTKRNISESELNRVKNLMCIHEQLNNQQRKILDKYLRKLLNKYSPLIDTLYKGHKRTIEFLRDIKPKIVTGEYGGDFSEVTKKLSYLNKLERPMGIVRRTGEEGGFDEDIIRSVLDDILYDRFCKGCSDYEIINTSKREFESRSRDKSDSESISGGKLKLQIRFTDTEKDRIEKNGLDVRKGVYNVGIVVLDETGKTLSASVNNGDGVIPNSIKLVYLDSDEIIWGKEKSSSINLDIFDDKTSLKLVSKPSKSEYEDLFKDLKIKRVTGSDVKIWEIMDDTKKSTHGVYFITFPDKIIPTNKNINIKLLDSDGKTPVGETGVSVSKLG